MANSTIVAKVPMIFNGKVFPAGTVLSLDAANYAAHLEHGSADDSSTGIKSGVRADMRSRFEGGTADELPSQRRRRGF